MRQLKVKKDIDPTAKFVLRIPIQQEVYVLRLLGLDSKKERHRVLVGRETLTIMDYSMQQIEITLHAPDYFMMRLVLRGFDNTTFITIMQKYLCDRLTYTKK